MARELMEDLDVLASYIEGQKLGNNTIMVTGATGFIGSLLIKAFLRYNQTRTDPVKIIGLARSVDKAVSVFGMDLIRNPDKYNVMFLYQDICDPIPDIHCDYMIHTASVTASRVFIDKPVEVLDGIYMGTKQVLEAARKNDAKGIVYLSSMEVFGQIRSSDRLAEKDLGYLDLQNVRSCYPEGKRIAELLCKSYAEEYNVPVRIARLAQVFGAGVLPGENRVFAQFLRSAIRGEDIVLHTRGLSTGNYCYTTDAIRAILLLLRAGNPGEAYAVVNEENTMPIAQMAAMVAEYFSSGRSKVVIDCSDCRRFGYAPDTQMRLSAKKLNELGWKASVPLIDMYRRMIPDLHNQIKHDY